MSTNDYEKEHVTQYFYRNVSDFKQSNYSNAINISNLRWTIDTELDYIMVQQVYNILYKENAIFLMEDILQVLKQNPNISLINQGIKRSAMYQ